MDLLLIVVQGILGIAFLMFGFMKFGSKQMAEEFIRFGYPRWFKRTTGLIEIIGGALLIEGIWIESVAGVGSLLVVGTMVGAILTHIKVHDHLKQMMMPIVLLILGLIVLFNKCDTLL